MTRRARTRVSTHTAGRTHSPRQRAPAHVGAAKPVNNPCVNSFPVMGHNVGSQGPGTGHTEWGLTGALQGKVENHKAGGRRKVRLLRSFPTSLSLQGFQEDEVPRHFPVSRLVSSTRNFDLELCCSPRFPALLTMALRRGEAGVPVFCPVLQGKLYPWSLIQAAY